MEANRLMAEVVGWGVVIILAVLLVGLVVGWLLRNCPEGQEIPGIGFVRKEQIDAAMKEIEDEKKRS